MERNEPLPLPGLRGALIFYLLTFALSWVSWGTLIAFPQLIDWSPLIILLGAYGPLIAAAILSRLVGGPGGARRWLRKVIRVRRQWRWVLLGGLILPLAIALAHLVIYRLSVGPVALSADPPWYWAVSTAPVNVFLLFWWGSAMEEFGWQGFALPRLTQQLPPLVACLLHGILWATWHLPLYMTNAWSGDAQPVWLLYGITLTLAPTMYWLTRSAAGSVMPAVLLHAATNHYSALFTDLSEFPVFEELLSTRFVEIKTVIYLAAALVLVAATRGRLGLRRNQRRELDVPLEVAPG
jgi:membrane protease YdiL (CAAX protease family)